MAISGYVKLVVFVPEDDAEAVREAMGKAGGGVIGNYTNCSFSVKGIGRFVPGVGSNPAIGLQGKPEEVPEERIEMLVAREVLQNVVKAMIEAHPYEEVAYDILSLEDL